MFAVAAIAILVAMLLAIVRAVLGPTIYDRILAVNIFGTKALLLIAVIGFLTERPEFLDIAIVYALINFIATIAIMKFFRFAHLGHPHHGDNLGDL
ncbi:MAG: monovalent cation/H+ antiporter complex subunit F [Rhodospirillales bacterium]|jgi:multicomponent Na+:H+ antiporter subunit F|nr:monovalent cation/H+ antiporter complex subunit F [Rhodospirillales bacterium]